jgi:hypothetical protein
MRGERIDQKKLAQRLGLTVRRVRGLEAEFVIRRGADDLFDAAQCERRYRIYQDHDVEAVCNELERLNRSVGEGMERIYAEPNIEKRRKIAKEVGPLLGELDGELMLTVPLGPAHEREFREIFVKMLSSRMFSEFLAACHWRLGDADAA